MLENHQYAEEMYHRHVCTHRNDAIQYTGNIPKLAYMVNVPFERVIFMATSV